ncbi:WecB/TagA/CpsF family glycosyltransferase [Qipengyuania vesicularis]|uniref:WecB/TagA/CpsF family glycosyltransferase n=1 Tax=Qipengyuania vesicularis TaxID=2867232 RepID=UPI001C88D744|nr:WecB/TagA/CpsF family glycosyltransferase [Qipengyuania vesicularis]MBX7527894.1 WecB/TagA/CpsF family glycosyltransferase [Qipengyuania vesicularis]
MNEVSAKFDTAATSRREIGFAEVSLPAPDSSLFFKGNPPKFGDVFVERRTHPRPLPCEFPRQEFIGQSFHLTTLPELLDELVARIGATPFSYLVTPNVDHLVTLTQESDDKDLQLAYRAANFMINDSRVLSMMARLSNLDIPAVPGSDITRKLIARFPEGTSIAVVGGDEHVHRELEASYPQFNWVFYMPPMGVRRSVSHQEGIVDFVCRTGADVTFLAIGAPQSELVCHKIAKTGKARGLALCIGASLEFVTGKKKRAPLWVQKAGLEWAFRLLSEPHRLAHRYLVKGPTIFFAWARWLKARRAERRAVSGSTQAAGQ